MGIFDRFRSRPRSGDEPDASDDPAPGRLPEGVWPGVAPSGLPAAVDVGRHGPSFALNAKELEGVRGVGGIRERISDPRTERAFATYLSVTVAVAADLKRRGVEVTELLLAESGSPWSALPFVPVVARAPLKGDGRKVVEVPVLVNPVPVTERETLSFFVFAGAVRRKPRFSDSPIAVYGPAPLPAPFARLADTELPGLLEGDLAPVLATRTPTPKEGARAFAEVVARRTKLHLDGSTQSLASLVGVFPSERFGSVARIAMAAYVGESIAAASNAEWIGKLPLAKLRSGEREMTALEMAHEFLPAGKPPRIQEFATDLKG